MGENNLRNITLKYATTMLLAPSRIPTSAEFVSLAGAELIIQCKVFRKNEWKENAENEYSLEVNVSSNQIVGIDGAY